MKRLIIWLAILLPFIANAQVNGTIQKTASSGVVRGNFGSGGADTIVTVRGVSVNGQLLQYNSTYKKWTPYTLPGFVPNSRLINSGYGLTGGGDLSNDRTLAVDSAALSLKYASTFASYKTAYVDTLGNNTTAIVGRKDKPFATISAAIDALGSSGIVQIGVGRFASPDSSKIKSNFIFQGSGKPVPDWTVSLVGSSVRKTSPTKLINGTVLYGTFDASREKNITISDLGIDVGSSWATTFNAGVAKDALVFAATDYLNPHPPLPGVVVQNVSTLGKDATSSFHAALFENLYYPIVTNLSTYYLAAGIVIKTTGGTYNGLQAFGHATRGLYIKANNEIVCRDVVISNVEVNDIINFDNGGAVFTAESGQNIFNVQLTNFSIRNVKGNGLTLSAQSGLVLDQILIANGNIDSVKNVAGADGNGMYSAARLARSIITGISLRDIDSTGVYLKNLERVTISNINSVVAGSYAFDLSSNDASNASNLYAYQPSPSNRGIRWAGSGMYGTNIINLGTTVGAPLTNLVAAFANLTTNGLLKTSGSNGALGTATAGTDYLTPTGSGASLTNVVNSVTGTASQITASGSTGAVTLSLPATINVNTSGNAATVTTNANLTGAVTSTGNATSLGSFSSSSLSTALTDETGTGSAVFATSPTLVTPVLGAASATSLGISSRLNVAGALDNASYPVQVKGNLSSIDANNQNTIFLSASPTGNYLATSWIGGGSAVPLYIQNNGINSIEVSTGGAVKLLNLAGSGTRMTVTLPDGTQSTQAIPGGGGGSVTGVAVATANGLAGTSDGASVVPTLTLTTTVNAPILAGNGTAISAATTTGTGSTAVLSASPALTGNPTAPTQTQGDNSTKIATTAYVDALGGTILGAQKQIATTYTNISTSGTSEQSLFNHNIAQSNLSSDGDRIDFNFVGSFGLNANDKYVRISVGGNLIPISGNASNKSVWEFEGYLMRTSSTTYRIFIKSGVDYVYTSTVLDRTVTDFNPLNFQILGQTNSASFPVTVQMGYLQGRKAP